MLDHLEVSLRGDVLGDQRDEIGKVGGNYLLHFALVDGVPLIKATVPYS